MSKINKVLKISRSYVEKNNRIIYLTKLNLKFYVIFFPKYFDRKIAESSVELHQLCLQSASRIKFFNNIEIKRKLKLLVSKT